MALVINTQTEHEYIPFSERGNKNPFTVTIKALGARELAKLEDGYVTVSGEETIALQQGSYNLKAAKNGIVSWKNLTDADGKEYKVVKNKKGEVLDSCLSVLPPAILTEVSNVIINISKFPESTDVYLGKIDIEDAE